MPQQPCINAWELISYEGAIAGPYSSQQVLQAFLQGKLNLDSRVRLLGHSAWKQLALYYHLLWEPSPEASGQPGKDHRHTSSLHQSSSAEQRAADGPSAEGQS